MAAEALHGFMHKDVKSPCIGKCSLNEEKICPGCYRNMEEIATWLDADDETKKKILLLADLRRREAEKKMITDMP